MKINKKGFILTETLIVSSIVVFTLIILYTQFRKLNTNYNTGYSYNQTSDIYLLGNIKKFFKQDGLIYENFEGDYIDITECNSTNYNNTEMCNYLIEDAGISKLIYSKISVTKLKKDLNELNYNAGLVKYISTIDSAYSDGYRLIAEFSNGRYANVTIDASNYPEEPAKIYGLRWDGNTTYTRLEDAEGMVANAGVGAIPATNDFDNAEIYKDIVDVTVDGNVFVKIPKFYIKKVVTGDTWEWYVSKERKDNVYYLPECFKDESGNELDYVLIGKYDASLNGTKLESKSGATPAVSISLDTARTYAINNNVSGVTGYQLFDIHAYDAVQVLFYIEFGTVNSQSIMYGYSASANSKMLSNGTTNIVVSSSGSTTSNSDGLSAMKYRGIENLYGNIYQFVDGIFFYLKQVYVSKKPSTYSTYYTSDGTFTSNGDYYMIGYNLIDTNGSKWISKMNYDINNPFINLPSVAGGSESVGYCDKSYTGGQGKTIMRFGGQWNLGTSNGINSFDTVVDSSQNTYSTIGARIMKKPL